MAKRLIVNADDFGLSPAVSQGILDAHQRGIVTSTTLMVNWPWSERCAADLAAAPSLGAGLHLNLTAGPPLSPASAVPSLVGRDGRFRKSLPHLLATRAVEVRKEWAAQVRRFCELMGRPPTHLDSHHHVHMLPHLARVAAEVAQAFGVAAMRVVRLRDLGRLPWTRWGPGIWLRAAVVGYSAATLERQRLTTPEHLLGLTDFDRPTLLRWLAGLPDGVTELSCHPGYVDAELQSVSGRLAPRPAEVEDLTHPEVRQALRQHGIQLITYRDLVT